jgi:hypothetical protein
METSIFESPTPLSETALLLCITGAPTDADAARADAAAAR